MAPLQGCTAHRATENDRKLNVFIHANKDKTHLRAQRRNLMWRIHLGPAPQSHGRFGGGVQAMAF